MAPGEPPDDTRATPLRSDRHYFRTDSTCGLPPPDTASRQAHRRPPRQRRACPSGAEAALAAVSAVNRELPAARLNLRCRSEEFAFRTTAQITQPDPGLEQQRVRAALELGVHIGAAHHNIFVMGRPGSGRHPTVRRYLERVAAERAAPADWCYLNRFDDPQRPKALRLPTGRATQLKNDMRELVRDLQASLSGVLESDAHHQRRTEIEREFDQLQQHSLEALRKEAERNELALIPTGDGAGLAPTRRGEILGREEFERIPEAEQSRIRANMERVGELLRQHLENIPRWHRDRHRKLRELDRGVTAATVRVHIDELSTRYTDCPEVLTHLAGVRDDLIDTAGSTLRGEAPTPIIPGLEPSDTQARLSRYDVNVLVDGRDSAGAPIVYEGNPTYHNLIGQIDNVAQFGILKTDFMLVRPGALHRANGGFLILDIERLLAQPFSWDALKQALFEHSVRIEPLAQRLSLISTVSLEPQRIPLSVRVVLIGTRRLYELLCTYDPEFAELFKIVADFDDVIERTPQAIERYANLVASCVQRENLLPLEASAVARLVEHGARLAGDSRKLSTHQRSIEDVIREANHFAVAAGRDVVGADDIMHSVAERRARLARAHANILEAIRRDNLLIETSGEAVGQINGLSVIELGQLLFGQPTRITAAVRLGEGEVIDIEREVKLGGAIHSKGVLILSALIGSRFGTRHPLSLHASLVFEQSYGGIEGDSASLAEACALLSAIAEVPLSQSLAVTGSINQHGAVQVIGGVNEKVEGFFTVCQQRGLTGTQGVILPPGNVEHLMLSDEVISAVEQGHFHIYTAATLDEAITLLTGLPAGEMDPHGNYASGSMNARAALRLDELAHRRQEFIRTTPPTSSTAQ